MRSAHCWPMARKRIELKTRGELQAMRAAGGSPPRPGCRPAAAPGVSTRRAQRARRAVSGAGDGLPAPRCVPGFPGDDLRVGERRGGARHPLGTRVLAEGDLFSIDAGCILDGWHADAAVTAVGPARPEVDLAPPASGRCGVGIAAAPARAPARRHPPRSRQSVAPSRGRRPPVRFGRRVRRARHRHRHAHGAVRGQPGRAGKGPRLAPGTALAIEPMLTLGGPATRVLADKWTVVTKDGPGRALGAHSGGDRRRAADPDPSCLNAGGSRSVCRS